MGLSRPVSVSRASEALLGEFPTEPLQGGAFDGLLAENLDIVLLLVVLVVGALVGYLVFRGGRRLLVAAGVADAIDGTAIERAARSLNTSTVSLLAGLAAAFVFVLAVLLGLNVAAVLDAWIYWGDFLAYLPQVFVAALVVIVGLILADTAELFVSERLRGVKLPQTGIVATLANYSVLFLAVLIALAQLGVAATPLFLLLGAYLLSLIVFGAIAGKELLASGAAGIYVLLEEPYAIGDEIRIDGTTGIVQEVEVLVTRIENDEEEYIVPNRRVLRSGVHRRR